MILLTSCTNRKSAPPVPSLMARGLDSDDMDGVVEQWTSRVAASRSSSNVQASQLYMGRSFALAREASWKAKAPLFIISAGLGLVQSTQSLPAYGLTVTPGHEDSIRGKVRGGVFRSADWWAALNAGLGSPQPVHCLAERYPGALLLLSLSGAYLGLVERELASMDAAHLPRVRLIGPRPSATLPPQLQPVLMPYDERLDGPESPIRGTASDFPQRALVHFIEHVLEVLPEGTAADHAARVRRLLAPLSPPKSIKRKRLSDPDILDWIERHWEREQGKTGRLLRRLRDQAGLACEQGRFSRLCLRVRSRHDATEAHA